MKLGTLFIVITFIVMIIIGIVTDPPSVEEQEEKELPVGYGQYCSYSTLNERKIEHKKCPNNLWCKGIDCERIEYEGSVSTYCDGKCI
jgi:hypothetical protein